MNHVLIIDDDKSLTKMARVNLEARGYMVDVANSGLEAIAAFKKQEPDLILLDLSMPDMSGIDVCLWIRTQSDVPILVLSGHDDEELKVKALDAGADDYVTKPFGYEELLARVRANMRRAASIEQITRPDIVEIDNFVINLTARRVFVDGTDVQLTQTEFVLMEELAVNIDCVVSHSQLLTKGWGPEYRDANHYLYIYFGRIRKKVGDKYGQMIQTVPRQGYILNTV